MIDTLQSSVFAKLDKLLSSIKSFINQRGSIFIYALLPLVNSQLQSKSKRPTWNTYIESNIGSFRSGKPIKTLFDPFIFTNRKNLSIDQWLSKM